MRQAVGSRRGFGTIVSEGRNPTSRKSYLCGMLLALLCASVASAQELRLARTLSGGDIQYVVRKGDSLAAMGLISIL